MSWTLPNDCFKQPDDETAVNDESTAFVVSFRGDYDALETAMQSLRRGDLVETGRYADTWQLRRQAAGVGLLTVNCAPAEETEGEGESAVAKPLEDLWELTAVRNDVSLLAYCDGSSASAEPSRAELEAWLKEPDGSLAAEFKYKTFDGGIITLAGRTLALARKMARGVECVIRFYAMLVRTRTYRSEPPECLMSLGLVDSPSVPAADAKKPGGLADAVAAREWLKCKDDAKKLPDGKWTRTEAWMGILKSDAPDGHPWDADLYGPNRWPMPYSTANSGGGGGTGGVA